MSISGSSVNLALWGLTLVSERILKQPGRILPRFCRNTKIFTKSLWWDVSGTFRAKTKKSLSPDVSAH